MGALSYTVLETTLILTTEVESWKEIDLLLQIIQAIVSTKNGFWQPDFVFKHHHIVIKLNARKDQLVRS